MPILSSFICSMNSAFSNYSSYFTALISRNIYGIKNFHLIFNFLAYNVLLNVNDFFIDLFPRDKLHKWHQCLLFHQNKTLKLLYEGGGKGLSRNPPLTFCYRLKAYNYLAGRTKKTSNFIYSSVKLQIYRIPGDDCQ